MPFYKIFGHHLPAQGHLHDVTAQEVEENYGANGLFFAGFTYAFVKASEDNPNKSYQRLVAAYRCREFLNAGWTLDVVKTRQHRENVPQVKTIHSATGGYLPHANQFFTATVNNPVMWENVTIQNTHVNNISPAQKKNDPSKTKIADIFKYKPLSKYVGLEGKLPVRAGTTFVGIEVELEKVKIGALNSSTWNSTEDHSLKIDGREFVTIPIQFKYLEVELNRLVEGLTRHESTSRCSVHVHLNVRDMSLNELRNMILLYMIFEKALYKFSGDRWNSNFCVPVSMYPSVVKEFLAGLKDGYVNESWYKYFGLNLSPIFGGESTRIGTVEFRHMKGNTDIKWIINWINLIVSLKLHAKKMDTAALEDMILKMNTTSYYNILVEEVFGEYSLLLSEQKSFKDDIESCITKAKYVMANDIPSKILIPMKGTK